MTIAECGLAQILLCQLSPLTFSRGKSWTQTISTCRDVCDKVHDKSETNLFVSL